MSLELNSGSIDIDIVDLAGQHAGIVCSRHGFKMCFSTRAAATFVVQNCPTSEEPCPPIVGGCGGFLADIDTLAATSEGTVKVAGWASRRQTGGGPKPPRSAKFFLEHPLHREPLWASPARARS